MTALYTDIDPQVCAWLRELVDAGELPAGDVLCCSILDLKSSDLAPYAQVHLFCGIGGWPYALRLAGWPAGHPVWTGSPPCQPFSIAGKGEGAADERHLAPAFAQLVAACRPPVIFGEQVASAAVFGGAAKPARRRTGDAPAWAWIDALFDELEAARYACGAADLPAAGIGAPHIRQRCFFGAVQLAHTDGARLGGWGGSAGGAAQRPAGQGGVDGGLAHADGGDARAEWQQPRWQQRQQPQDGGAGGVAHPGGKRRQQDASRAPSHETAHGVEGRERLKPQGDHLIAGHVADSRPDAPHPGWNDPDWLGCRDGRWRPVEPGLEPLAHGLSARVGRLRGYGNAIVPQLAAEFIAAFVEAAGLPPLDRCEEAA